MFLLKKKGFKNHLTIEDRIKLEELLDSKKYTIKQISEKTGIAERTIYMEKSIGTICVLLGENFKSEKKYVAIVAHNKAMKKREETRIKRIKKNKINKSLKA